MKSANEPSCPRGMLPPTARANSPALEFTTWVNSAPQAAIPVAMPIWRKVEFTPEAIPARAGSTIPTAAVASAGLVMPIPMPQSRKPGSSAVQSSPASRPLISSSPIPTRLRPPPTNQRTPKRSASLPEMGATMKDRIVTGRKRRPDSSAL